MEIIAHRGASGYAPENTMAAFKKALEMDAKAIEFDVQMTSDGELVVIHDDLLDRTTSGSGLVIKTDYTTISSLDAGSWFGQAFVGEKVPLLSEVLDLLKDRVTIHLEVKKIAMETRAVEEAIYELVKEKGMVDQVIFSSFHHGCLKVLQDLDDLRIGVLTYSGMIDPVGYMKMAGLKAYSYNPAVSFVNDKDIEDLHEHGIKVLSYTCNELWLAHAFSKAGVDAVFSNYPDIMTFEGPT